MSQHEGQDGAEAWARARREVARRLHPDRGGDPGEFDREMRALEASDAAPASPPSTTPLVRVHTTRAGRAAKALRTTSKTLVADVRRRLPRSFPGSRRYGRL